MARPKASYDVSEDLYLLATTAAQSVDPVTLRHGFAASMGCIAVKEDRDQLEATVRNAGGQQGDKSAEREAARAAQRLLSRCRGFIDNDPAANQALRARIAERIRDSSDAHVAGVSAGAPTTEQIRSMIERQDTYGFEMAYRDIEESLLRANGLASGSPAAIALAAGFKLALCDLGKECSADSFVYSQLCAHHRVQCAGSLDKLMLRGLSEDEQAAASRYRTLVARAFQQQDYAFFGLRK